MYGTIGMVVAQIALCQIPAYMDDHKEGMRHWSIAEGGNGNRYIEMQRSFGQTFSWASAKENVERLNYRGQSGHLVTFLTQQEWGWFNTWYSGNPAWIGLTDNEQFGGYESVNQENPQRDGWAWVTGEPVKFIGWGNGQPDNWSHRGEDYVEIHSVAGQPTAWNDVSYSDGRTGYIVEFEQKIGDSNDDWQFDIWDIVHVLERGKYKTNQSATWGDGDWNGDGIFDHWDMVQALESGTYDIRYNYEPSVFRDNGNKYALVIGKSSYNGWDWWNETASKFIVDGLQGHLVTIKSQKENSFVYGLVRSDDDTVIRKPWIGIRNTDDGWRWIDGTEPIYTRWTDRQGAIPLDENPYAIMSLDGKWLGVHDGFPSGYAVIEWETGSQRRAAAVPEPDGEQLAIIALIAFSLAVFIWPGYRRKW